MYTTYKIKHKEKERKEVTENNLY